MTRSTPEECRDCGGVYVHSEDCLRAPRDEEDEDEEREREACPDCREACDPWTEDGKPCGLERGEEGEEGEEVPDDRGRSKRAGRPRNSR